MLSCRAVEEAPTDKRASAVGDVKHATLDAERDQLSLDTAAPDAITKAGAHDRHLSTKTVILDDKPVA